MRRFAWAPIERKSETSFIIEQIDDASPEWSGGKLVQINMRFEQAKTIVEIDSTDNYTTEELKDMLIVCTEC